MAEAAIGQMAADTFLPQQSTTSHLSGAALGSVATLLLGDRLARPSHRPAVRLTHVPAESE